MSNIQSDSCILVEARASKNLEFLSPSDIHQQLISCLTGAPRCQTSALYDNSQLPVCARSEINQFSNIQPHINYPVCLETKIPNIEKHNSDKVYSNKQKIKSVQSIYSITQLQNKNSAAHIQPDKNTNHQPSTDSRNHGSCLQNLATNNHDIINESSELTDTEDAEESLDKKFYHDSINEIFSNTGEQANQDEKDKRSICQHDIYTQNIIETESKGEERCKSVDNVSISDSIGNWSRGTTLISKNGKHASEQKIANAPPKQDKLSIGSENCYKSGHNSANKNAALANNVQTRKSFMLKNIEKIYSINQLYKPGNRQNAYPNTKNKVKSSLKYNPNSSNIIKSKPDSKSRGNFLIPTRSTAKTYSNLILINTDNQEQRSSQPKFLLDYQFNKSQEKFGFSIETSDLFQLNSPANQTNPVSEIKQGSSKNNMDLKIASKYACRSNSLPREFTNTRTRIRAANSSGSNKTSTIDGKIVAKETEINLSTLTSVSNTFLNSVTQLGHINKEPLFLGDILVQKHQNEIITGELNSTIASVSLSQHSINSSSKKLNNYKRNLIFGEIKSTENHYVSSLLQLVTHFVIPLQNSTIISIDTSSKITRNLVEIYNLHKQFLQVVQQEDCESATQSFGMPESAESFDSHMLFIVKTFDFLAKNVACYIDYCTGQAASLEALDLLKKNKAFMTFAMGALSRINNNLGNSRLEIKDYLMKPVQRICKYPLFIRELLAETRGAEAIELEKVLKKVEGVCKKINEAQKKADMHNLTLEYIKIYKDNCNLPISLIKKLGTIYLSGTLNVVDYESGAETSPVSYGCVLFNRFFIINKVRKGNMIEPKYWFPLHTMAIQIINTNLMGTLCWRLVHRKSNQHMDFSAHSPEESKIWIEQIYSCISESKKHALYSKYKKLKKKNKAPRNFSSLDLNRDSEDYKLDFLRRKSKKKLVLKFNIKSTPENYQTTNRNSYSSAKNAAKAIGSIGLGFSNKTRTNGIPSSSNLITSAISGSNSNQMHPKEQKSFYNYAFLGTKIDSVEKLFKKITSDEILKCRVSAKINTTHLELKNAKCIKKNRGSSCAESVLSLKTSQDQKYTKQQKLIDEEQSAKHSGKTQEFLETESFISKKKSSLNSKNKSTSEPTSSSKEVQPTVIKTSRSLLHLASSFQHRRSKSSVLDVQSKISRFLSRDVIKPSKVSSSSDLAKSTQNKKRSTSCSTTDTIKTNNTDIDGLSNKNPINSLPNKIEKCKPENQPSSNVEEKQKRAENKNKKSQDISKAQSERRSSVLSRKDVAPSIKKDSKSIMSRFSISFDYNFGNSKDKNSENSLGMYQNTKILNTPKNSKNSSPNYETNSNQKNFFLNEAQREWKERSNKLLEILDKISIKSSKKNVNAVLG
ncbi:hypothetical protein BB561_001092 [Smittium simulii]|uniref:DH domain-containing protein n=1 Tax=Smittium simulii TaxID=133385 RepID=A0A2T9YW94_9FUNG|nr:hypothetical protein BB561_001092 [Smittium simulii]